MWMVKNAETVLLLMAAMIAVSMIAEICVALWLICYFRHGEDAMRVSLDPDAAVPTRAFATDAGLDLYSPTDIWVPHQGVTFIDTGVHVEICDGYAGEVRGRSGLSRRGVMVATGTIDSHYRGSLGIVLYNVSGEDYHIHAGDRIAQLVIEPALRPRVEVVDVLPDTDRAGGGFGSTGR